MKKKLLISACLCGVNSKYNGKNNLIENIDKIKEAFDLYYICPESDGGLTTPRDPSEIFGNQVISSKGKDVTEEFNLGASKALKIAKDEHIKLALLKEGSPSCGVKQVYDGTFTGRKIEGQGITSKRLKDQGIIVFNEFELEELLKMQ